LDEHFKITPLIALFIWLEAINKAMSSELHFKSSYMRDPLDSLRRYPCLVFLQPVIFFNGANSSSALEDLVGDRVCVWFLTFDRTYRSRWHWLTLPGSSFYFRSSRLPV
jgi:hypothetical protein